MSEPINLSDVTFIIPVRIESDDRMRNMKAVFCYLGSKFQTNLIVAEHDGEKYSRVKQAWEFAKEHSDAAKNLHVRLLRFETPEPAFHRTLLLNRMLLHTTTKVVVNYDCDIILPAESYVKARDMIVKEGYQLVYPFAHCQNTQRRVELGEKLNVWINGKYDLDYLDTLSFDWPAAVGFCQFFDGDCYYNNGGEDTKFVAYGPEDVERFERFSRLGCKIGRVDDLVFHLEHGRNANSSPANPFMKQNEQRLEEVRKMPDDIFKIIHIKNLKDELDRSIVPSKQITTFLGRASFEPIP